MYHPPVLDSRSWKSTTDSQHKLLSKDNFDATSSSEAAAVHNPIYQVVKQPQKFFKRGKFFMAYWVEPQGYDQGQSKPHSKNRRFMVVRSKKRHCLCLSVHTYQGQATSKPGVRADDHAAVIREGGSVILHPEERELHRQPIHVILEHNDVTIDGTSRMDFSRIYTVEYNVPVKAIGRILHHDLEIFETYLSRSINLIFQAEPEPFQYISQWLGKHPQYKSWQESRNSLLWITDDLVSESKSSTLGKQLIDQDLQRLGRRTICYLNFEKGRDSCGLGWTTALYSLLFQLLSQQPMLQDRLKVGYTFKGNGTTDSSTALWERFLELVKYASGNVSCVLDGLDENEIDRPGTVGHDVVESLKSLYSPSGIGADRELQLNFIVTSRFHSKFECRFENSLCGSLTEGNLLGSEVDESTIKLLAKDEKALRCGFTPMVFHNGAEESFCGDFRGSNGAEKAPPGPQLSAALPTNSIRDSAIPPEHSRQHTHNKKPALTGVQETKEPRFSPARLIDVGVSGCTNIILRETNDVHEYIALSYHWDGAPPLTLVDTYSSAKNLKDTIFLQDFRTGLQLSKFPKTFRDAIRLVQSMKLRYLWIDCLCLLSSQDEPSTQTAPIHAIYANALCVLVAQSVFDNASGRLRLSSFLPVHHHIRLSESKGSSEDLDRRPLAEAYSISEAATHEVIAVSDEHCMARLLVTRAESL